MQHCVNHPYAEAVPTRHSGASRNLVQHCEPSLRRNVPHPSFRHKPESRACGHIHRHPGSPNRHSSASRNPGRAVIFTVIPARRNPASATRRLLTFRRQHSLSLWHGQSDCPHPLRPPLPSCRPSAPTSALPIAARPIRLAIQNPPKIMTPVCLTLRNLSAILSPIR